MNAGILSILIRLGGADILLILTLPNMPDTYTYEHEVDLQSNILYTMVVYVLLLFMYVMMIYYVPSADKSSIYVIGCT